LCDAGAAWWWERILQVLSKAWHEFKHMLHREEEALAAAAAAAGPAEGDAAAGDASGLI
jgi:hypothetical protein